MRNVLWKLKLIATKLMVIIDDEFVANPTSPLQRSSMLLSDGHIIYYGEASHMVIFFCEDIPQFKLNGVSLPKAPII